MKIKNIFKRKESKKYSVITTDPTSSYAESFRKIPINLKYINVDNEPKVIQITSSLAHEHKTSTCVNLAAVYSELKNKVVIIDCDLRRPKVHRATQVLNDVGLTNYLVDNISFDELIKKSQFGFDVITSGESVPFAHVVLRSEKFQALIEKLRGIYDYIIIDSPPVLLVTDSLIISEYVDSTIFVINQKSTKKQEVRESLKLLIESNANIAGIVLSNADKRILQYKYERYY